MHMADALLSPLIGGAFWVVSGSLIGYSAKKIAQENDSSKVPFMGVMGAFIFAAQMINFAIPGTGSSGHLGGGLLLAILLGPYRAFICLASVLFLQCMLFADGGIMALGCNIFNLAFFPAFVIYPLISRYIIKYLSNKYVLLFVCIIGAIFGLQFGALFVILQTVLSGISALPFKSFTAFMLPIHFAIGLIEGIVTWGVLNLIYKVEPSLVNSLVSKKNRRMVLISIGIIALITGGFISYFASSEPDGLEWSIAKSIGTNHIDFSKSPVHSLTTKLQEKLSFLPDYSFKPNTSNQDKKATTEIIAIGTSVAGVIGAVLVFIALILLGLILQKRGSHLKS